VEKVKITTAQIKIGTHSLNREDCGGSIATTRSLIERLGVSPFCRGTRTMKHTDGEKQLKQNIILSWTRSIHSFTGAA
jgi:hypothetical protein